MSLTKEYKCPLCGGTLAFDAATQKLVCPYCDHVMEVDDFSEQLEKESSEQQETETKIEEAEDLKEGFVSYECESCGGEIITQSVDGSFRCPYCGNNIVAPKQFSGMIRPHYIIPFAKEKEEAKTALENHIKGHWFLPKDFAFRNKIDSITGVYVPFWLYDCDLEGNMDFHATRVTTWQDSNYRYTKTDHYQLDRSGALHFHRLPVDGASRFDDALMKSIEPFQFDHIIDFDLGYLAGFGAQRYDVGKEVNIPEIEEGTKKEMANALRNSVIGYHTCIASSEAIKLQHIDAEYALLPVWMLSSTYQGKIYTFAMNGQTGKFVGNLPMDKRKYWSIFASVALVSAAIIYFLCRGIL